MKHALAELSQGHSRHINTILELNVCLYVRVYTDYACLSVRLCIYMCVNG